MKGKRIEFEKLIIERLIIEARYFHGYLYWDNCGRVWKTVLDKWPAFKEIEVSPQKAVLKMYEEGLELRFDKDNINIGQDYPPPSLKLLKELSNMVIPLIAKTFELESFTRIGNRIFYLYPTDNPDEAADIVRSTGLLDISKEKMEPFGDKMIEPRVRFVVQNDDIGYTFNLSAISRKLNVNLPKPIGVDTSKFISNAVMIDVDYFTRKPVDLSVIDFGDLIDTVQKNFKYNLTKLFW